MPLTPTRIQRIPPKALYFDGVDDYVTVGLSGYYEVTVEMLLKPVLQPSDKRTFLLAFDEPLSLDIVYDPRYSPKGIRGYPKGEAAGTMLFVAYTLTEEWQDTTMYWKWGESNNTFKLWVNGSYVGEYTDTKDIGNPKEYTVLKLFKLYDYPYKGYTAFVRIYSRALSDSEIRHNFYNPDNPVRDGLVLWLHWDSIDVGAGVWYDKSGYGNHGTIYGAQLVNIIKSPTRILTPARLLSPVR